MPFSFPASRAARKRIEHDAVEERPEAEASLTHVTEGAPPRSAMLAVSPARLLDVPDELMQTPLLQALSI
jgi:hypothetical protein